MKPWICLLFLPLSACLTMPKPEDPGLVAKLHAAITRHGAVCDLKGYRRLFTSTEGGMINLRDGLARKEMGLPPVIVTRYVVDCGHETAYHVELAESGEVEPWSMVCDHHTQSVITGACTHRSHR